MNPTFKFQTILANLSLEQSCPCNDSSPRKELSFRWINNNIPYEQNFLPTIILDELLGKPSRVNEKDQKFNCKLCGLSFFDNEENALKKFLSIPKASREKMNYTHISSGLIEMVDGVCAPVEKSGHFEFYEFEAVNIHLKFVNLKTI